MPNVDTHATFFGSMVSLAVVVPVALLAGLLALVLSPIMLVVWLLVKLAAPAGDGR